MTAQRLLVFQTLWAMDRSYTGEIEPSLEAKLELIAASGYDGVAVDCDDPAQVHAIPTATALGLAIEGQCTPRSDTALKVSVELAAEHGFHHLTVQPGILSHSVTEATEILGSWQSLARGLNVPMLIETHRERMTNDLPFTLDLLQRLPDLMLLGRCVALCRRREMELPLTAENDAMIRRSLDRCWAFHGQRREFRAGADRTDSFPQHRKWVEQFKAWWEYGFRSWRRRAASDDTLCFSCELGPPPYAITDANNRDSTDRWQEAALMAGMVRERWQRTIDDNMRTGGA